MRQLLPCAAHGVDNGLERVILARTIGTDCHQTPTRLQHAHGVLDVFDILTTPEGRIHQDFMEGSDIPMALQKVAGMYQGRQQVTIKVKDRDEQGNVVGMKEITTNRNAWDVRKLEEMQQEVKERMGEASRRADRQHLVIKVFDRDAPRAVVPPVEIIPEKVRDSERTRG